MVVGVLLQCGDASKVHTSWHAKLAVHVADTAMIRT